MLKSLRHDDLMKICINANEDANFSLNIGYDLKGHFYVVESFVISTFRPFDLITVLNYDHMDLLSLLSRIYDSIYSLKLAKC